MQTWQCKLNNVIMPDSEIFYSEDLRAHIKACFPEGPILGARFHEPKGLFYYESIRIEYINFRFNSCVLQMAFMLWI